MTGMVSIFQEWQGFPVNRVVFMPNDTRKQFSNSAGGKTFKKNVFKNLRKKTKKTTTNFIDTQIHEHNCFIAGLMLSVSAFTMANK